MFFRKRNRRLPLPSVRTAEPLEARCVLSASAFGLGNTAAVTLSFAPDGTDIMDQPSGLFAKFDSIANRSVWQQAILDAFQTWAIHTNADVGLVSDDGNSFGSEGETQSSNRFGDVRIGAMPMGPGVMALSMPQDIVSGTWVGDVIFNTNANFATVDDIFAVAMHEAGNVFGLEDNDNPESPMFSAGTVPRSTAPTPQDIANLQTLFGDRAMDRNELVSSNDSQDAATRLRTSSSNGFDGSAPVIAYGDVSSLDDVDVFRLDPVDDYTGSMTIQVRSLGISQLEPRLRLLNRDGDLIASSTSSMRGGEVLSVNINPSDENRYYVYVDSIASGHGSVGGYSVIATFDDLLQLPTESVDTFTGGGHFRFMEQDQIQDYLRAELTGEAVLLNDDGGMDNSPSTPTDLETVPGFAESTRYQSFASFSNVDDVDHYTLRSADASLPFATVRLSAVGVGSLSAELQLVDRNNQPIDGTILVNDGRGLVIQYPTGRADSTLGLRATPRDFTTPQNYELSITFDAEPVPLTAIANGTLTQADPVGLHTVNIERHQLTHFVVSTSASSNDGQIAVNFRLRGNAGDIVSLAVPANETRTAQSVLLRPGSYVAEVLASGEAESISYSLQAVEISDPLVSLPDDPTDKPPASDCPGLPPELCDPPPAVLPGDATGDGRVDFLDFLIVSANFGMNSGATWQDGDFDGDEMVAFSDFLIVSQSFGKVFA